jgi:hypothetical protein
MHAAHRHVQHHRQLCPHSWPQPAPAHGTDSSVSVFATIPQLCTQDRTQLPTRYCRHRHNNSHSTAKQSMGWYLLPHTALHQLSFPAALGTHTTTQATAKAGRLSKMTSRCQIDAAVHPLVSLVSHRSFLVSRTTTAEDPGQQYGDTTTTPFFHHTSCCFLAAAADLCPHTQLPGSCCSMPPAPSPAGQLL